MTAKERMLRETISLVLDKLNTHESNGFLLAANRHLVPELTLLTIAHAYANDTLDLDYMMDRIRKYKEVRK